MHIFNCLLNSSNPKKRYELFLKATQMDVIIEKLNGCLQQIDISKAKFKLQQKQHYKLLEIQKKAQEKLNQFKSMEPLKVNTKCLIHSISEFNFSIQQKTKSLNSQF